MLVPRSQERRPNEPLTARERFFLRSGYLTQIGGAALHLAYDLTQGPILPDSEGGVPPEAGPKSFDESGLNSLVSLTIYAHEFRDQFPEMRGRDDSVIQDGLRDIYSRAPLSWNEGLYIGRARDSHGRGHMDSNIRSCIERWYQWFDPPIDHATEDWQHPEEVLEARTSAFLIFRNLLSEQVGFALLDEWNPPLPPGVEVTFGNLAVNPE